MTEKELDIIQELIPESERFIRAYSAYEGGLRVITEDRYGNELRYFVHFGEQGAIILERRL